MSYYKCQYCGQNLISGFRLRVHAESKNCSVVRGLKMQKGITLIEAMIVVSIVVILAAVAAPAFIDHKEGRPVEYGVVCKSGYKFTSTGYRNSGLVQIIDERGHGIPCDR